MPGLGGAYDGQLLRRPCSRLSNHIRVEAVRLHQLTQTSAAGSAQRSLQLISTGKPAPTPRSQQEEPVRTQTRPDRNPTGRTDQLRRSLQSSNAHVSQPSPDRAELQDDSTRARKQPCTGSRFRSPLRQAEAPRKCHTADARPSLHRQGRTPGTEHRTSDST